MIDQDCGSATLTSPASTAAEPTLLGPCPPQWAYSNEPVEDYPETGEQPIVEPTPPLWRQALAVVLGWWALGVLVGAAIWIGSSLSRPGPAVEVTPPPSGAVPSPSPPSPGTHVPPPPPSTVTVYPTPPSVTVTMEPPSDSPGQPWPTQQPWEPPLQEPQPSPPSWLPTQRPGGPDLGSLPRLGQQPPGTTILGPPVLPHH